MKKLTLVLVTLAFAASMAVAEDVTLSVSGSATVEWGFAGQLIDNTGSFLDAEVASGDFYASDDAGDLSTNDPPEFAFTLSVEDADGNVIVEAAANDIEIDSPFPFETDYESSLDYISFPNVIPGILGITLEDDDVLEPDYAPSGSASENERILINVTPMGDALDVTVGLLIKPDNKLLRTFYDGAATEAITGTFTWADDGDIVDGGFDDDDFDDSTTAALDANGWEAGTYLSWAASLEATFTAALGDEDEISVGVGTVIDSAFTSGVYEADYLVDLTDNTYSRFTEDVPIINDAGNQFVIDQMNGAIAVNALSIKDMMPTLFDAASTVEPKDLRTNEVLGRATIPVGLGVTADVAGLSAAVDFQMVLAEGNDENNLTGIIDIADETKNTINFAPYAMPMYASVDVGYELAVGDMTITPGVNFKYSSDFWKWGFDAADDEEWEYMGDVSGADWVGRPMSVDVGLDVEGIAGMIDVSVSASIALGDGDGNHGMGIFNDGSDAYGLDPFGLFDDYNYTVTDDAGTLDTVVMDNTLAEVLDFWYLQPTQADFLGSDNVADSVSDGVNNMYFGAGASAMGIEVGITVAPIDGLTIENTTSYEVDNLGIGSDKDTVALFGIPLSTLENETVVEYDWMVGDAVAFTIFGEFTYASESYWTEDGQSYVGLRTTADPAGITDTFEFSFSEAPSMATFDYAVGVKCSVGL
jgi:hypothetical protein